MKLQGSMIVSVHDDSEDRSYRNLQPIGRGGMGEIFRAEPVVNGWPCEPWMAWDPLIAAIRDAEPVRRLFTELRQEQERYAVAYRQAMTRPFSDSSHE